MDNKQDFDHLVSSQPQITLSQYEYRVSRLPVRRHPRRRKRQHQAPTPEHSDEVTPSAAFPSPNPATSSGDSNQAALELSNITPARQSKNEPFEHNDHLPTQNTVSAHMQNECHSLPSADTILEYDSNSNLDNTFTAPTAHMYLDDDGDQALLRDANDCDSDVPTTNPDDEDDEQDSNYVSPISTQDDRSARIRSERKVLNDVDINSTESPLRKKSSRPRKRSKLSSAFEAVLASNQLIMVSNGSVESGSFHEAPYSSPDEDEIEDSQMHIRHHSRKPSRTTRTPAKTVTAKALHQRMKTINSALADADRFTTPTPSRRGGHSKQKRAILDVGDGFDAVERKVTRSSLWIKKSGTKRRSTPYVSSTGLELESSSAKLASLSQAHRDDDGDQLPTAEGLEEIEEHDEFEEAGNSLVSVQDLISRIANMAHTIRKANLSGKSRRKGQTVLSPSRKQRASKSRRHPTQLLELAINNDLQLTRHSEAHIGAKEGGQWTLQSVPQPKTPIQRPRQFRPCDGFDGYECNSILFTVRRSAPPDKPQAATASSVTALSHPGNFAAVRQLAEEDDDPIEDDGPTVPQLQYMPSGMLQFERPQHVAVATTPRTAQAAYATPPTTVGTYEKRPSWDEKSRFIIPAQVSRMKYDDLAEQTIEEREKELNDATFGRPPSAAYSSPSCDRASGDTQIDQSGMMLDDGELTWDSSTRPSSISTDVPFLNTRHPPKPLKELTRQVSRNFGTISPEKNAIRRTTSHLLTSKAPFRRQEGASRLSRAG